MRYSIANISRSVNGANFVSLSINARDQRSRSSASALCSAALRSLRLGRRTQLRIPFILALRVARYEGRSAWNKEPIEEERRTTNQEARLECVHSFSRVWRNKGRSGSSRSFARHSEKAGSQPKKSRYRAPPYCRLPVFGQSLPNRSRRSPPSGTTPSLRRWTSNARDADSREESREPAADFPPSSVLARLFGSLEKCSCRVMSFISFRLSVDGSSHPARR